MQWVPKNEEGKLLTFAIRGNHVGTLEAYRPLLELSEFGITCGYDLKDQIKQWIQSGKLRSGRESAPFVAIKILTHRAAGKYDE